MQGNHSRLQECAKDSV